MSNVTIIMPVSRPDHLDRIFAQLELLDCNRGMTSILCYIDGGQQLYEKARNLVVHSKFKQRLCVMRSKGQPSVGSVRRRRQRIADIHNEVKELIDTSEYIFIIEDDTLFPTNTLDKLLKHYYTNPHAGLISAAELGRWGYTHIGAWDFDDVYEPNKITSPKLGDGLQKIDATGLYCCLMKTETYMNHKFEPFEDALGPDTHLGMSLRRQGYQNYIDYSIKCTHLTKKEPIKFSNSEIVQVQLIRDKSVNFGWRTTTI